MEVRPIKKEKDVLLVELKGDTKSFANLIREELWNDKATDIAGFRVTHPQVGVVEFTLRTKGKQAKSVWNGAVDRLSRNITNFNKPWSILLNFSFSSSFELAKISGFNSILIYCPDAFIRITIAPLLCFGPSNSTKKRDCQAPN